MTRYVVVLLLLVVLLLVVFLLVVLLLTGRSVVLASLSHALGSGEAAVISGRWGGRPDRALLGRRVMVLPGERLHLISLGMRSAECKVQCRTQDRAVLHVMVRLTFQVGREERDVLEFFRNFGEAGDELTPQVDAVLTRHLQAVLETLSTEQAELGSALIIERASGPVAADFAGVGLSLVSLGVDVLLPDGYETARARQLTLRQQIETTRLDIHQQDLLHAAQVEREKREAQARADQWRYEERHRIQTSIERVDVDRHQREADREHQAAQARLAAEQLQQEYAVRSEYEQIILRTTLVERLPQVLEAQGKLLPELRTYIGGSDHEGLPALIKGLASHGLPIMEEVRKIFDEIPTGQRPLEQRLDDGTAPVERPVEG
ncbi:SPFH domain-containing protein [Streptomyces sp. YKOK-I1]